MKVFCISSVMVVAVAFLYDEAFANAVLKNEATINRKKQNLQTYGHKNNSLIEYEGILAKAEGEIITAVDVENRLKLAFLSSNSKPSEKLKASMRKDILKELIDETLKYKWAMKFKPQKSGWVSKEEVEDAFEDVGKRNKMSKTQFFEFLNLHKISAKALKDQILHQITWVRYIEARYGRSIKISEKDIDIEYQNMINRERQDTYDLFRLFIPFFNQKYERKAFNIIMKLKNMIENGADIRGVARQFSKSKEADQGGDMGWVVKEQITPQEYQAVSKMDIGSIKIVKNKKGYSLLILKDKKYGGQKYFTTTKIINVLFPYPTHPASQEAMEISYNLVINLKSLYPNFKDFIKKANETGAKFSEKKSVIEESMPKDFQKVVKSIKVNSLSEPIPTPEGILIIYVSSRQKNHISLPKKEDLRMQKFNERIEILAYRELQDIKKRSTWEVEERFGLKGDYM